MFNQQIIMVEELTTPTTSTKEETLNQEQTRTQIHMYVFTQQINFYKNKSKTKECDCFVKGFELFIKRIFNLRFSLEREKRE